MADEKSTESMPLLWQMVGFLFFLFILLVFITGSALYQFSGDYTESNLDSGNPDVEYITPQEAGLIDNNYDFDKEPVRDTLSKKFSGFSLTNAELKIGDRVINREDVSVRNTPAGAILGTQLKRTVGKLVSGPFDSKGVTWWRVDYEEAPDGWVEADQLTSKIGTFRLLNIFPILFDFLKPILIGIVIVFAILIVWVRIKFNKVLEKQRKKKELLKQQAGIGHENNLDEINENGAVYPTNLPTGDDVPKFSKPEIRETEPTIKNEKWEHVTRLMGSRNSSDWRQAIVEADIILDEMLIAMGYEGESIGEKLKKIEPSDFITLNKAWEAHKVRNKIAHSGSDFSLSKDQAEKTIKMYQQVFDEFYFI